ncbi:MAG: hypothetical protein HW404_2247, partial [Anaerolineales bacterium]|nr:hypothetical protein [Anaerolineales bacterium]
MTERNGTILARAEVAEMADALRSGR